MRLLRKMVTGISKHEIRVCSFKFAHLVSGSRTFEYRESDQDFQTGDVIRLREWCPIRKEYTGRELWRKAGLIMPVMDNDRVSRVIISLVGE